MKAPLRLAARIQRFALLGSLVLMLGGVLWFRTSYALLSAPGVANDVAATHPPGSLCLVVKHPATVQSGDVVFVDEPPDRVRLTRIEAVRADGWLRLPDGSHVGRDAVRARVMTVFGGKDGK